MKKKLLLIPLALLLIISLVAIGCPATPTTPPTTAPPTTAPPTTAPPTTPAEHEPYEIQIVSLPAGYSVYTLGIALAKIINENSTWLHAVGIEGKNPLVSTKTLIAEPELKKTTVFFMDAYTPWAGEKGIGGYADTPYNYSKFRGLFTLGAGPNGLVVADPKIKSLQDLKGKRVVTTGTPGSEIDFLFKGIFEEAGILDEVKLEYMAGAASADALRDGLVHAIMASMSLRDPKTDEWGASPYVIELAAMKDTYPLSIPAEYINAFAQKSGCPAVPVEVPPGTIGPLQTEPCTVINKHLVWAVHVDMPDDVVEEILRIVYENAREFVKYDPLGEILSKETMATMGLSEERVHPAAVQFYKKHGIPITNF